MSPPEAQPVARFSPPEADVSASGGATRATISCCQSSTLFVAFAQYFPWNSTLPKIMNSYKAFSDAGSSGERSARGVATYAVRNPA